MNTRKHKTLSIFERSNFKIKHSQQTIGKHSMNAIKPKKKISGSKATNTWVDASWPINFLKLKSIRSREAQNNQKDTIQSNNINKIMDVKISNYRNRTKGCKY